MYSGEERPAAPVRKGGVIWSTMRVVGRGLACIWSIIRTIGWGLVFIGGLVAIVHGLWVSFEEFPLNVVGFFGVYIVLIGLGFLSNYNLAISGYFGSRGCYGLAEFFLKKMTIGPDNCPEVLTRLGDLYFFGLGRDKDWREATTYYGQVLALDLKARQAVKDVFDLIRPDEVVIDWSEPDCLPNLKKIAEAGQAGARQVIDRWRNDDPFKGLFTKSPINNRPEDETDSAVAKNG